MANGGEESGREQTDQRRKSRSESTRSLLASAIHVFAAKGYDAATTKEIASAAGLNEQLISRYFGGKAGLLNAVFEDFLRNQDDDHAYAQSPVQFDVCAEIEQFLVTMHHYYISANNLLKTVVPRILVGAETRPRHSIVTVQHAKELLTERLINLQDEGLLRAELNASEVSRIVAVHSFAQSFIARNLLSLSDEQTISDLREFARITAYGLRTQP